MPSWGPWGISLFKAPVVVITKFQFRGSTAIVRPKSQNKPGRNLGLSMKCGSDILPRIFPRSVRQLSGLYKHVYFG